MPGIWNLRRDGPRDNPSERLAALMQDTGSAESAMELLVGGLAPDQRATLAKELLSVMPPPMVARVLGNSFTGADWSRLRDTARHRRPLATLVEGTPVEFTQHEPTVHSHQLHECYLANLALDRTQVFCHLPR